MKKSDNYRLKKSDDLPTFRVPLVRFFPSITDCTKPHSVARQNDLRKHKQTEKEVEAIQMCDES